MNNFIRDYLVKLYIPRITWTDIIEIVIIAFVIYNVMVWIKNTKAWVLLKGIIIVILFALIAYILNLKTILWIAGKTISVGIIALVSYFSPNLEGRWNSWDERSCSLVSSDLMMEEIRESGSAARLLRKLSERALIWEQHTQGLLLL